MHRRNLGSDLVVYWLALTANYPLRASIWVPGPIPTKTDVIQAPTGPAPS